VLTELVIRNLAIAEELQVEFSSGLNVITGETGAGKSLIIEALAVLLGGRSDSDMIRTGEDFARVDGVFDVGHDADPAAALAAEGIELDDGRAIISREVRRAGRGTLRINGRPVAQSQLVAIGQGLVDIHGQGDYMSLLRPREHLLFLDRFAGAAQSRQDFSALVRRLDGLRDELQVLELDQREQLRRAEQLQFEVAEIESARLEAVEEDTLRLERARLSNAEQLASLAQAISEAIDGGEQSAIDALGQASAALAELARIDNRLADRAAALEGIQDEVASLSREMRAYRDDVEFNPQRLEQIEERLAVLASLKRKYGATIVEVTQYGQQARNELDRLAGAGDRAILLRQRESELLGEVGRSGRDLSLARRAAAKRLAANVEQNMAALGMEGGRFAILLKRRADDDGVDAGLPLREVVAASGVEPETTAPVGALRFEQDGLERVEFLVSLNPGEDLRPLARVASGGETSRLMLILKSIIGQADQTPTLVFDEVDAGIGGRAALAVGRRLAELGRTHQVICISHLPQIAAQSDIHLSVTKEVVGGRTLARVSSLNHDERVVELAQMIGGRGEASVAAARELLTSVRAAD
jgi:DNA repair protein RecN (Recombination protein N)